ncbi:MAG TPA: hypothetical protein VMV69_30380 [Pirellulales bacterium]|nr:hypothetical protein [Pirellulales bacterium]
MNDYDKAGRYLVKREPAGFFRWLLANPAISFEAWIDARRVALPDQNDLTNDLVAALRSGNVLEGLCVELEVNARADVLTRLLDYLTRLWTEPGGPRSLRISCVSGAVLDLTRRSPVRELSLRSVIAPGSRLELTVLRRHLADEKAASLLADVAAGKTSPWLLAWVPLMRGGGEPGIIAPWVEEAQRRLTDDRDRADLGSMARVFATLAGGRSAWDHGLRGWNMKTSPIFDEIRAERREEGREEGRAEGIRASAHSGVAG